MKASILVIEDHEYLRTYTKKILLREGYDVQEAGCGREALDILKEEDFDVLLLDLDLGDMDGTEIIRILRRQNFDTPIIVISNFEQVDTKVNAFNLGCDDYITKPFYKEELLARIKRMRKRVATQASYGEPVHEELKAGPFLINYRDCTVSKEGVSLAFNRKLFDLLSYFLTNRNQIITKAQLFQRIWGEQEPATENTLSVHIHMLREQLEADPRNPVFLITKRGQGYIMKLPQE